MAEFAGDGRPGRAECSIANGKTSILDWVWPITSEPSTTLSSVPASASFTASFPLRSWPVKSHLAVERSANTLAAPSRIHLQLTRAFLPSPADHRLPPLLRASS